MKREELKALGLSDEQIEKVMKQNGMDIEKEKAKTTELEAAKAKLEEEKTQLTAQVEKANKTIEGFGDYEETKAAAAKYKEEAETAKKEMESKLAQLEIEGKVKDFTAKKNFVNELTRKAINSQLKDELNKDENKGKSLEDLYKAIIGDSTDIEANSDEPKPPKVPNFNEPKPNGKDDDNAAARAIMGLPPLK